MAHTLANKTVLITGAARGIGSIVVRKALSESAQHVVVLDVDEKSGVALQNELNEIYGANKVKFVSCDVTNEDQLRANLEAVLSDKSRDYVVINNAGILNDSLSIYKKQIAVNVTALVTSNLIALELMRKDKGGRGGTIINISSIAAFTVAAGTPIYSATKSAVLIFSTSIGLDEYYNHTQVRVLTLCFGATDTGLLAVENMGTFDEDQMPGLIDLLGKFPLQSADSAAQAVLDMYKAGASASVWLSNANKPAQDITAAVNKAYGDILSNVFN